jgi:WD40 repeat protein
VKDWFSHSDRILGSSMSPDGECIATISADETLRIWRLFDKLDDIEERKREKDIMRV